MIAEYDERYVWDYAFALSGLIFLLSNDTGRCPVLLLMPFQGKFAINIFELMLVYNKRSDRWEKGSGLFEIPEISRIRMLK